MSLAELLPCKINGWVLLHPVSSGLGFATKAGFRQSPQGALECDKQPGAVSHQIAVAKDGGTCFLQVSCSLCVSLDPKSET